MILHDSDIRSALHEKLHQEFGYGGTYDEVGLVNARIRTDIIQFVDNQIIGFEIKSDADELKRLPKQVKGYSMLCDKVYLVVGDKLKEDAMVLIPDFWGVILVESLSKGVSLNVIKDAQSNPNNLVPELFSHCSVPKIKKLVGAMLPKPMRPHFRAQTKYQMLFDCIKMLSDGTLNKHEFDVFLRQTFQANLDSYKPDVLLTTE